MLFLLRAGRVHLRGLGAATASERIDVTDLSPHFGGIERVLVLVLPLDSGDAARFSCTSNGVRGAVSMDDRRKTAMLMLLAVFASSFFIAGHIGVGDRVGY